MGLTDRAMKWMVEEAMAARDRNATAGRSAGFGGLKIDPGLFAELDPDPLARQHDERASITGRLWMPGTREGYVEAPELASVAKTDGALRRRFDASEVPLDGGRGPYRPVALARHPAFAGYYAAVPASPDPGPPGG